MLNLQGLRRIPGQVRGLLLPPGTSRVLKTNLALVVAFAAVAVGLLTGTLISSMRISHDIDAAVNPAMADINDDTLRLPALDRTAELTEKIYAAGKPLAPALSGANDENSDVAGYLHTIRDNTASIGDSIAGIDESVRTIRATVADIAPLVAAIKSQTADITGDLGTVATATDEVRRVIAGIAAGLAGTAGDVRGVEDATGRIRRALSGVHEHTENVDDSAVLQLTDVVPLSDLRGTLRGSLP